MNNIDYGLLTVAIFVGVMAANLAAHMVMWFFEMFVIGVEEDNENK